MPAPATRSYTTKQDWVAEVKRLTGGEGVDVVYDSVGKATFLKGLDCLKPRGMMVHFGVSSGQIEPFDTRGLTSRGSLFLARPTLNTHISDPKELAWRSSDVFRWIAEGKLKLRIDREYPLAEAAQAHRDLEARATSGKVLLHDLKRAGQAGPQRYWQPLTPLVRQIEDVMSGGIGSPLSVISFLMKAVVSGCAMADCTPTRTRPSE